MRLDESYFALFGLPETFDVDVGGLEAAYREVLGQVHPDRFASGGAGEQRVALQFATRANEAYRVLRDPLARARYLAELRGAQIEAETDTAMDPDFLVQQMQWREDLEEARAGRDSAALRRLADELQEGRRRALAELNTLFAAERGRDQADLVRAVRELMFLEKLGIDVEDALAFCDDLN